MTVLVVQPSDRSAIQAIEDPAVAVAVEQGGSGVAGAEGQGAGGRQPEGGADGQAQRPGVRHGQHAAPRLSGEVANGSLDPRGDRLERLAAGWGEGGVRLGTGQDLRRNRRPQLRPEPALPFAERALGEPLVDPDRQVPGGRRLQRAAGGRRHDQLHLAAEALHRGGSLLAPERPEPRVEGAAAPGAALASLGGGRVPQQDEAGGGPAGGHRKPARARAATAATAARSTTWLAAPRVSPVVPPSRRRKACAHARHASSPAASGTGAHALAATPTVAATTT